MKTEGDMKAFNVLVITVFAGVVGFITYSLVKDSRQKYYAAVRPEVSSIEEKLFLSGYIYPGKEIEIKPQISGVVDAIHVSVGDPVKEGDPIASISLVPNSSEVEQLSSSVNLARIKLESARIKYERQKQLYEAKAVSRADFEVAEQEYLTAKENYSSAEHQLELRKKGKKTAANIVRASTSGVIIDIPIKVGTSVMERSGYNPGSTVAVLAGTEYYLFRANVPERNMGSLHIGMPVKLSLPALDSLCIEATIMTISSKGEMQSGAVKFPIEAMFAYNRNDHILRSGYSASGELLLRRVDGVLTLPEKCVNFHGDTSYVYVTDSLKRTATEKIIHLGLSDGKKVQITEGISEKDLIITNYHD